MWPDNRITSMFNIKHPIILAPMAGPGGGQSLLAALRKVAGWPHFLVLC